MKKEISSLIINFFNIYFLIYFCLKYNLEFFYFFHILIKNNYTLNNIDCLALDNYIKFLKIYQLSAPKMKRKKIISRKIKKI